MAALTPHKIITEYISIWLLPSLLLFGLVGNFLCLLVILKRSPFPKDVRSWFAVLCVTNLFILSFSGTDFYLVTSWGTFLSNQNVIACKILNILNYTGHSLACWIQTGISLLRAHTTIKALRRVSDISPGASSIGLAVVIVTNILVYTPICISTIMFHEDVHLNRSGNHRCYTKDAGLHLIDIVLKDTLPLVTMIICSIIVFVGLRRATQYIRNNTYQRIITLTLFLMNVAYFFCQLPYNIFSILVTKINISEEDYLVVAQLLISLSYLHFSCNWLFFLLSARFRKYLRVTIYLCVRTTKRHQDMRMKMLV